MKTLVSLLLWFVVSLAIAGDIGLDFKQVSISQLAEAIVKGILKQDYVIAPEASGVESKVTLSVHGLDLDGVKATLSDVLNGVGLQLSERRGVLYLEKKGLHPPEVEGLSAAASVVLPVPVVVPGRNEGKDRELLPEEEPRIYFPKYRGSDYLSLAVRAAGARLIDGSAQHQQLVFQQIGQYGQFAQQAHPINQPAAHADKVWRDVLIYSGRAAVLEKVEKLLAQLDRPSVAVQLRGAVLEVSDSSENVRSLSGLLSMLGGRLGLSYSAGATVGNAISISGTNLSAVLSAVDGDTRFKYLSEPSLRVLEGETAKLTVGQDVPIRGAIQTDNKGNTVQSVEYKTAGLVFEVTPTVYQSVLRLKIGQQISSFTTTTTSGIDSPTMLKREASTIVQAEDGELIAIAGLDDSKETASSSGLSFLPSFLQSKNNSKTRSQILLLLEVKKLPALAI